MQLLTYKIKRIVAFSLFLYVCTFFSYGTYATSRTFHSPHMCLDEGRSVDCSFQFPVTYKNSCLIHNTSVCSNYDFSTWNLEPFSQPASESDSEFTVSVLPYAVYIRELLMVESNPVSAVNISLTSLNKGIGGFSIVMTDDVEARNICRIFDFRNSLGTFNLPFTLFYDCFHYLVEDHWEAVTITFRAYPLNIELSYFVYIPSKPKNLTSPCDWIPLVMIFRGSLPKHFIQMKFSNAPRELNITFFILTLWSSSGVEIQRTRIPSSIKQDMISKEFFSLEGGFYTVSVGIISAEDSCTVFRSHTFLVGEELIDYSLITFLILLIIMIIIGSVLLYFLCRWYLKSDVSSSKPTVLLFYHYKPLQHEFLVMYGKYLEDHYGVKVNTIYGRSGNPKEWLEEKYSESHVIIFVISEGLFQIFDQNISYEEEHHWVDQLPEAKALINDSKIGEKKFCKICFPYSRKKHIPKCLEHRGPVFVLPNDENEFLCFIHDCSRKLYLLNKLCCEKHHKVSNFNLKYEDEEKMKEKLVSILENKFDALPIIQFKNIDESNIYIQNEYEKQPDTLNEKYNFTLPGDSLSNCKAESIMSSKHKLESKDVENDDFFLYCVRKMLNSE